MAFEIAFLIGRILFGGFHVMSGMNHFMKKNMMVEYTKSKNIPAPDLAVMATGILLLLGGLSILLGIYVNWGVLLLVIFYIPTLFLMHNFWKFSGEEKMTQMRYFMSGMALLGASLMMLAVSQPWVYSV